MSISSPVEYRRLKFHPPEFQYVVYDTPSSHLISRLPKTTTLQSGKTQVVYMDDKLTNMTKKVIIDPRTGDREIIYEKDIPKKRQNYFIRQRPTEILIDSDDDDDDDDNDDTDNERRRTQYAKVAKFRTIPTRRVQKKEPPTTYFTIKKRSDSEPVYALTSKMPAIKNDRRIVYKLPSKKPSKTYVYTSDGKYYK